MAVNLNAQRQIYDGANSKWVKAGGSVTVSFDDQAAAASQNTAALGVLGHNEIALVGTLGDISGSPSGQTLDAKLQYSIDGTKWTDLGSGGITQLTAAGTNQVKQLDIDTYAEIRIVWTLGFTAGTSPTMTATRSMEPDTART